MAFRKNPVASNSKTIFSWIFFNPDIDNYDTLSSDFVIHVDGESRRDLVIESTDLGNFYNKMNWADNELNTLKSPVWPNYILNATVVLLMGFTLFTFFRKSTS